MKKIKLENKDAEKVVVLEKSLTDFKTSTEDKLGKIVGVLETLSQQIAEQKPKERNVMMATAPEKVGKVYASHPSAEPFKHNLDILSPDYQAIFEKYFDMTDGFIGNLRGVEFKIEVPINLSNAIDAYKDYYKKDIRCKILDGNDIEGSMEAYCKLVCQNLKYNRKIALRI
mgnify:CR=1 FL=1